MIWEWLSALGCGHLQFSSSVHPGILGFLP